MSFLDRIKSLVTVKKRARSRVVIMAADGMDPRVLERLMKEGRVPNMKALMDRGGYTRLGTTIPAESPVAWSSFATGTNPGKHGIFDFLHRDPITYAPKIAPVSVKMKKLGKPEPICNRSGATVWKIIGDAGYHSTVMRVPVTFPPEKFNGRMLSGLGVPDLRGTWGTSVLYEEGGQAAQTEMGGVQISLVREPDGTYRSDIVGPRRADAPIPFTVKVLDGRAVIEWQGHSVKIAPDTWSDWLPISFSVSMGPLTIHPKGIFRFFLHRTSPMKLYLSPISLDPVDSFYPVTQPAGWSKDLAGTFGNFCTLGWMEDTWGLNEGRIDEDAFIDEADLFTDKLEEMVFEIVESKVDDFMIAVFEATDRNQHMFWRFVDPEHPARDEAGVKRWGDVIDNTYIRFDRTVGEVAKRLDRDTIFMVMSDHGFNTFRRAVNVNTWLKNEGYLVVDSDSLKDDYSMSDLQSSDGTFWPGVDWNKSRAYSLGLGKIYINMKGRESKGIVNPGREYEQLRDDIIEKFSKLIDPKTGKPVVSVINKSDRIFSGPRVPEAGDLVIGFHPGYRVSWQTALGGFPPEILQDNDRKWSADHCSVNSEFAKGIFLCSEKYPLMSDPNIMDLAPTILRHMDIEVPADMDGKPLQDKK